MLMLRFFATIIKSNAGKKIGVDTTTIFVPEGHFEGHKVC